MRAVVIACVICLTGLPVWADARVTVLMDALRISDLVSVTRQEGLADAYKINDDMLAGQGGAFWQSQVDGLYNVNAMQDVLYAALLKGLDDEDLDKAVLFFDSLRGQKIVGLEIAARRAMIDVAMQDAAFEAYKAQVDQSDPHTAIVAKFMQANDLLELNVATTLSASYQFYRGMADGGLLDRSDSEILTIVWASEELVRAQSQEWLSAYLMLAYGSLGDEDLDAYLDFSRSPPGKALNAALFAGFESMFKDIAYGMGRAVALNAIDNDI